MNRTKTIKEIDKFWLSDIGRETFYQYLRNHSYTKDFYQHVIDNQKAINYAFEIELSE